MQQPAAVGDSLLPSPDGLYSATSADEVLKRDVPYDSGGLIRAHHCYQVQLLAQLTATTMHEPDGGNCHVLEQYSPDDTRVQYE